MSGSRYLGSCVRKRLFEASKTLGAQVLWRPDWKGQPLARVPLSHALAQLVLQGPYAKGDVCETTAELLALRQSFSFCYAHSSLGNKVNTG